MFSFSPQWSKQSEWINWNNLSFKQFHKALLFRGLLISWLSRKILFFGRYFAKTVWRGRGGDRRHSTHASMTKRVDLVHHMEPKRLDKDWLAMEEEKLFVVEKLPYRPWVIFIVSLFCPDCVLVKQSWHFAISWRNGFRQHTTQARTVRIWECTGSFLEELVQHHFVYWTYQLRKYTNHTALK